ncbi:hypothetical protein N7491_002821 [Penicillium cf. griseofulvum]|uniref:Uncharacterized protein n=1 Tax=Penicillium cf. griseofulvum TaxID=2972120 RepID=A0A9W9MS88_9EURO|nr:hypothetical protein N7472_003012 [Penicillium cf. griseofulvum]KAJ5440415.1 hypothetical protein N7491_002821 [Penicillium cf. griseofulvum]KAJ5448461.1 hypothetical protein N7445_003282 [Penicillium cf. griseofulvum]
MATPSSVGSYAQGRAISSPYPTTTLEHQYSTLEKCIHDIELATTTFTNGSRADGSWIVFYGVDERAFDEIRNSEHELLTICTKLFNPSAEVLVLKMESLWHSSTSMAITRWIDQKSHAMNVGSELLFTGTGNYKLVRYDVKGFPKISDGNLNIVQKRADQVIHPFAVPPSRTMKWPTFVLEVAYTEARNKVKEDMRIWLQATEGQVNFAMTASIQRQSKRIKLEQWGLVPKPTRKYPNRVTAEPVQNMWIKKPLSSGEDPTIGGRFEIPFKSLFLRDRQGDEEDFLMTHEDITRIARDVWRVDTILTAQRQ